MLRFNESKVKSNWGLLTFSRSVWQQVKKTLNRNSLFSFHLILFHMLTQLWFFFKKRYITRSQSAVRTALSCCKTIIKYGIEVCFILKRCITKRRALGIFILTIYHKTDKFPSLTLIKPTEFCYSFLVTCQVPGGSNIFLWLGLSGLFLEVCQISSDLYNRV